MLGVANLAAAVAFYRDVVGLDPAERATYGGPAFEQHWRLEPGIAVDAVALRAGASEIGRVVLIEFGPGAPQVRAQRERSFHRG